MRPAGYYRERQKMMKVKKIASLAGLVATSAIGAAALTAVTLSAGVASATGSPGDQDARALATEMNAAATSTSDEVTATQARNNAFVVCGMRSGELSGPAHPKPFTEGELIAHFGADRWATVIVTRGEYHFCPAYSQ